MRNMGNASICYRSANQVDDLDISPPIDLNNLENLQRNRRSGKFGKFGTLAKMDRYG